VEKISVQGPPAEPVNSRDYVALESRSQYRLRANIEMAGYGVKPRLRQQAAYGFGVLRNFHCDAVNRELERDEPHSAGSMTGERVEVSGEYETRRVPSVTESIEHQSQVKPGGDALVPQGIHHPVAAKTPTLVLDDSPR
jgi:hypothetical protein